MRSLVPWLQIAGCVQIGIVAANCLLPRLLSLRSHLAPLPLMLRQIFLVHWLYIILVLLLFSALCLLFAGDLAGGTALGRAMSAFLAFFWSSRLLIQVLYYDPALRRRHRAGHVAFTAALVYLVVTFAAAACTGRS